MIFDAMDEINDVVLQAPVCVGDVVIENLAGSGIVDAYALEVVVSCCDNFAFCGN